MIWPCSRARGGPNQRRTGAASCLLPRESSAVANQRLVLVRDTPVAVLRQKIMHTCYQLLGVRTRIVKPAATSIDRAGSSAPAHLVPPAHESVNVPPTLRPRGSEAHDRLGVGERAALSVRHNKKMKVTCLHTTPYSYRVGTAKAAKVCNQVLVKVKKGVTSLRIYMLHGRGKDVGNHETV